MEQIKKLISEYNFHMKIYEKGDEIIFWNDVDIKYVYPLKKILKIINKNKFAEFYEKILLLVAMNIQDKYKKNTLLSVIIPNYNNEQFIVPCIESILENTYENKEIILVDDCSTDNSVKKIKEKFGSKIKIIENEKNSGTYFCQNRGLLESKGNYVMFIGGDDFINANLFQTKIQFLRENKENMGYGSHFKRIYLDKNEEKLSNSYIFLYRRKIFNLIGFFHNSRFGADSEFIERCMWNGQKLYFDKSNCFYFANTLEGKNLTNVINKKKRLDYEKKYRQMHKNNEYINQALLDEEEIFKYLFKYMSDLKVGIVGLGFVGSSMLKSFELLGANIAGKYDKYKDGGIGTQQELLNCDVLFSALPTVYSEKLKEYNKQPLYDTLHFLKENNFTGVFVCKSTVEPGTCEALTKIYGIKMMHNPEFLTARTAFEDFHNQDHIVLGRTTNVSDEEVDSITKFYNALYPKAIISHCTSTESESMKIFCNCYYSVKIQFFNELYLTCKQAGMDYKNVVSMMLKNKWINPMHTDVPGPDGQLSYGGLCFPKDTNALNDYMVRNKIPNKVLDATIRERNEMREDKDNCE